MLMLAWSGRKPEVTVRAQSPGLLGERRQVGAEPAVGAVQRLQVAGVEVDGCLLDKVNGYVHPDGEVSVICSSWAVRPGHVGAAPVLDHGKRCAEAGSCSTSTVSPRHMQRRVSAIRWVASQYRRPT
jgi:hypothetical protein